MNHLPKMSLLIVALLALPATSPLCAQTKAERTHELLISNVWTAVAIPVALGFDIARSGYKGAFSRDILERRTFWIKVKNSVSAVFTGKNWKERFVGNELTKSFPALGRWTRAKNFVNANPLFMIAMTVALGNVARSGHELYYFEEASDPKSGSEPQPETERPVPEERDASKITPQQAPSTPTPPPSASPSPGLHTQQKSIIYVNEVPREALHLLPGAVPTTKGIYSYDNGRTFLDIWYGTNSWMSSPLKKFKRSAGGPIEADNNEPAAQPTPLAYKDLPPLLASPERAPATSARALDFSAPAPLSSAVTRPEPFDICFGSGLSITSYRVQLHEPTTTEIGAAEEGYYSLDGGATIKHWTKIVSGIFRKQTSINTRDLTEGSFNRFFSKP